MPHYSIPRRPFSSQNEEPVQVNWRRGLFRVDIETGATSPLVRELASTYRGLEGVWAEEGKAIFYIHEDAIRMRDLATSADRPLYRGAGLRDLALSFDGQWLAFVSTARERDVLLVSRVAPASRLPVTIADDPLASVMLGTGRMLSDFRMLRQVSID